MYALHSVAHSLQPQYDDHVNYPAADSNLHRS